jgi:hypothetical protein
MKFQPICFLQICLLDHLVIWNLKTRKKVVPPKNFKILIKSVPQEF